MFENKLLRKSFISHRA